MALKPKEAAVVREYSINGESKNIREILLNNTSRKVYLHIKSEGVCKSRDVAKRLKLSLPNSSKIMKKLYHDGYLNRDAAIHPSGGYEHIYYVGSKL